MADKKKYTYDYPMQSVTGDAVVIHKGKVLLIKRNTEPFKGCWALPGGHLDPEDESALEAAERELKEETGIDASDLWCLQLGAWSKKGRDPRGRYITIAYLFMADDEMQDPTLEIDLTEVQDAKWFPTEEVTRKMMAFDHFDILLAGFSRAKDFSD